MIFSLFKKDKQRDAARSLYITAMAQSRLPIFYTSYGVPDSFDARFDLVTLHVYLVMRALKKAGDAHGEKPDMPDRRAQCRDMSQKLFDAMFRNLDDTLREMGVGDLSVSKKIRPMAEAFYGRVGAYEAALGASGICGGDLRSDAPDEMPTHDVDAGEPCDQPGIGGGIGGGIDRDLAGALLRNVYGWHENDRDENDRTAGSNQDPARALAAYVNTCDTTLAAQPIGRILTGIVTFPEPPAFAAV